MAKAPVQQASSRLQRFGMGPKLIGAGVALFVLNQIIQWLPLGWVDGPIIALLWMATLACVLAGGALVYFKAQKS